MRGKLLTFAKRAHLYMGVFFSPLLLMFILTGWWQTMTSDDDKEREGGFVHDLIKKFSEVHTDDQWPRAGVHHYVWLMKWLVVSMCVALIISILLGIFIAWQTAPGKWRVIVAFALGILVPALIIYIA
jgi:4-amino-4-deoxy-L-arabinose transferase-like glycosyltransferase